MPTVLRLGALRVVVYPNDHRPAHVHVIGNGCEAVFRLNCPAGPVQMRENYSFAAHETAGIAAEFAASVGEIMQRMGAGPWHRMMNSQPL